MFAVDAFEFVVDSVDLSRKDISAQIGRNKAFVSTTIFNSRQRASSVAINTMIQVGNVCGYSLILAKSEAMPENAIAINEKED